MNKFKEIFLDLEEKILEGIYPANTLLPSETQLMKTYHVSRETVRKALNLLSESGYIQKQRGKGSIVLDREKFKVPISGLMSYKELEASQNMNSETVVISLKKVAVSPELSKKTGWIVSSVVWEVVRQRKVDEEVIILDIDYLHTDIVPVLTKKEAENSIYDYLEEGLDLEIAYAQKEITVEQASLRIQRLMELSDMEYVVLVSSLVYLEDTRCFEYTESRHKLDKFKFTEFARRRKL